MRKSIVLVLTGFLLAASAVMPVSAHGHHHNQTETDTTTDVVCEVCTVEGCNETGRHAHNDETYCGYAHECGYCDNSCVKTANAGTGRHNRQGRHHGR